MPGTSRRKTKILCTLGPATESTEMIGRLIAAGADSFRLNMSHAKHDWVRRTVRRIRDETAAASRDVSILMDLQGPAIRTGAVDKPIELARGDSVEITMGGAGSQLTKSVSVNYDDLGRDVKVGDTVLVDNGVLHLRIVAVDPQRITCEVLTEGVLGSRRHINLPGVKVNLPALTEKDLEDLEVALELGGDIDFVAMSFVRDAEQITALKKQLAERGSKARVVAKIEDQQAVRHLDAIIEASDAIMIARGDLGIECPMEDLPIIQRRAIQRCARIGRKVIVATHLLESMIENPVPTRAEVTDVANATFEQADVLMLSGETSIGAYPVRCVEALDTITRRIERTGGANFAANARLPTEKHKTVRAAVDLANSLPNSKIIVFTARGVMAHYVAYLRPEHAPIYAFSPARDVCRALTLARAVCPIQAELAAEPEVTIAAAVTTLRSAGEVSDGDPLVILSDILLRGDQGDMLLDSILLRSA